MPLIDIEDYRAISNENRVLQAAYTSTLTELAVARVLLKLAVEAIEAVDRPSEDTLAGVIRDFLKESDHRTELGANE